MRKVLRKFPILYTNLRKLFNYFKIIYSLFVLILHFDFNVKLNRLIYLTFSDNYLVYKLSDYLLIFFLKKRDKINSKNSKLIAEYFNLTGRQKLSLLFLKKYLNFKKYKSDKFNKFKKKYRYFSSQNFSAIGHIAFIDFYIKSDKLKLSKEKDNILIDNPNNYSNSELIKLYGNYLKKLKPSHKIFKKNHNFDNTYLFEELGLMNGLHKKNLWLDEWAWFIEKNWIKNFGYRSLYKLSKSVNFEIEKKLSSLGFKKEMWFVTLHIREDGGGQIRGLRNANPLTYTSAVKEIIKKGGWVFRIGGNSISSKIPIKSKKFVDLTEIGEVFPKLDAYLLSNCRFFIGTGSGPANIASHFFCRPTLLTNCAPLSSRMPWPNQMIIPKMYFCKSNGKVISLSERLNNFYGTLESNFVLRNKKIEVKNNSDDEILHGCNEMIELTDKGYFNKLELDKNKNQIFFKRISSKNNKICPVYCSSLIIKKYPEFLK